MSERRGLLLDLDGTLADTAGDFTTALNAVLSEHGRSPLSLEAVRPHVSHGVAKLVQVAFGCSVDTVEGRRLRERLLVHYEQCLCAQTRVFDGMHGVLEHCERNAIPWGVVTNKPGWLTVPLMESLGLADRVACVVSGDTLPHRKPHPLPVCFACERMDVRPAHCLFVGDAERDVRAGRAAGTTTLVALFGYIGPGEDPARWGADGLLGAPGEILPWLMGEHAAGQ